MPSRLASTIGSTNSTARVSNVCIANIEWFKDDFGAKRNIEIAPKLKSATGYAKAKIVGFDS